LVFLKKKLHENSWTGKLFDIMPYRVECLIWANSFKNFNLKNILKFHYFGS